MIRRSFTGSSVVVLLLSLFPFADGLHAQCGVERWSVKTGTDPDAGLVNLSSSTNTVIPTMTSWTAPSPIPANNRVAPYETTQWVLNATLTQYKLETDSDYHLVLTDSSGNTMIAEIPSPACVGSGSPFLPGIQRSRSEFDAVYAPTGNFQPANVPVQIRGVGMFDFLHGQTGVAPNGIEVHPVLDIVFNPTNTSDFSLSESASSVAIGQGSSGTVTVSSSVTSGFNSSVALSASGLPSGTTASFSPASIAAPGSGSSTMTITVGSFTAAGAYTVAITGSGGGKTHSINLTLNVTTSGGTALTNGGFETGSLSPWTSAGTALVSTGAKHSGTYGAQVGSTSASTDSSIAQTFTLPAGSPTVSFWFAVHCPDTVTYDWATATLKDNVTGTTTTLLAKTCTNTGSWVQVNYAASTQAGHSVTLTLANHDDNYAGDPTYTDYDDVAVTSASPAFSIGASPTSVSVAQGASGTSTLSTTVSGGFNSAISLSASGAPAGTTVSFNPASIAAPGSGSSTMTMAVGASTAAGTYTITVTGTGGGITHTASVSLTVTVPVTNRVANGGFETGTSSSWTSTGTAAVNTSARHSGTYGAMVGSTSPSGDSSIAQTFTLGTSSPTVSFWYANTCPDTVTYDWATATVKDNATGTTATLLAKTCTATPTWTQVNYNAAASAGHSVTLTLTSHDDNYAGDPTYTYYDDVIAH
jgi:hypothetical protein